MDWLDNEIDKWWCSHFTTYKMKRILGHKFIPDPAYTDEYFKQTENDKIKIAFELGVDWQVDFNDIEWTSDEVREFAKYFYNLGQTC